MKRKYVYLLFWATNKDWGLLINLGDSEAWLEWTSKYIDIGDFTTWDTIVLVAEHV